MSDLVPADSTGAFQLAMAGVSAILTFYGLTRKHPFHGSILAGLLVALAGAWMLHTSLDQLAFIAAAYLILVTAAKVATSQAVMHSVFWLSLTLVGVAVMYLFLGAQVLAAVQVLIYVGAVITLILFTVIMTTPEVEEEEAEEVHAAQEPEESHVGSRIAEEPGG